MKGMAQAEGDEMFVSTAAVGSIVGLQSAEIQQMAEEYAEKSADLAAGRKPDKVVGAQAHQRRVAVLGKQITTQEKRLQEVRAGMGRERVRIGGGGRAMADQHIVAGLLKIMVDCQYDVMTLVVGSGEA